MGWFVIVKKSTTLVLGVTIIDKILSSMQEVMKNSSRCDRCRSVTRPLLVVLWYCARLPHACPLPLDPAANSWLAHVKTIFFSAKEVNCGWLNWGEPCLGWWWFIPLYYVKDLFNLVWVSAILILSNHVLLQLLIFFLECCLNREETNVNHVRPVIPEIGLD